MQLDYAAAFRRHFGVDPSAAALMIIDLQYATGSREHGLGAVLAAAGDQDAGRWRFDRVEQVVLPNVQRLLRAFRTRGQHVIYVTLGSRTGDFTDIAPHLRQLVEVTGNRAGTRSHEILDGIRPQDGELVVNKTTASAFLSSDLHRLLQERGVRQLLLTGVSTNSCVESTGRDAADLGYDCVLVEDCCSCAGEGLQRAAVANFARLFGRVATSEQLLTELAAAAGPSSTGSQEG